LFNTLTVLKHVIIYQSIQVIAFKRCYVLKSYYKKTLKYENECGLDKSLEQRL